MSFKADMLASLALHAAAFGVVATAGMFRRAAQPEQREIPIYFEIVEAAAPDADRARPTTTPQPTEPEKQDEPTETQEMDKVQEGADCIQEAEAVELTDAIPEDDGERQSAAPQEPKQEQEPQQEQEASPVEDRKDEVEDVPMEPQVAATGSDRAQPAMEERAKVVSAPIALNRITPAYPRAARRKGHEGSVTVQICVAADGAVAHSEVVASSGHRELDEAALSAVDSARFAPATEDGVRVSGELRLTFDFRLR